MRRPAWLVVAFLIPCCGDDEDFSPSALPDCASSRYLTETYLEGSAPPPGTGLAFGADALFGLASDNLVAFPRRVTGQDSLQRQLVPLAELAEQQPVLVQAEGQALLMLREVRGELTTLRVADLARGVRPSPRSDLVVPTDQLRTWVIGSGEPLAALVSDDPASVELRRPGAARRWTPPSSESAVIKLFPEAGLLAWIPTEGPALGEVFLFPFDFASLEPSAEPWEPFWCFITDRDPAVVESRFQAVATERSVYLLGACDDGLRHIERRNRRGEVRVARTLYAERGRTMVGGVDAAGHLIVAGDAPTLDPEPRATVWVRTFDPALTVLYVDPILGGSPYEGAEANSIVADPENPGGYAVRHGGRIVTRGEACRRP